MALPIELWTSIPGSVVRNLLATVSNQLNLVDIGRHPERYIKSLRITSHPVGEIGGGLNP